MIQFLKESTFAANKVLNKSWKVLRANYFSIAGLCFSLFLTSNTSGILAFYIQEVNPFLSAFMAFLFVIAYFGIQLTLFKYIFKRIDQANNIKLFETIPTTRELTQFFLAMLYVALLVLLFYLLTALAGWPLIYWFGVEYVVNGTYLVCALITLYFLIRVAFYPFFIIDRNSNGQNAIRLSVALTKGNFYKLLVILGFFAILHLLYVYFNYLGYPIVSTILSVLNSFFVAPFASVVVAVAYRDMIKNYGQ